MKPALRRVPLSDALTMGAPAWDALAPSVPSPFVSWAWHRAWSEAAPAEANGAQALVLSRPNGAVQAVFPFRLGPMRFHRAGATALTWAIGDLGCPDHLDLLAAADADLDPLVAAVLELDWEVLLLGNVAPGAHGVRRLCEAIAQRGHVVRRRPLWPCPYLELPADWERYLATLSPTRRQTLRRKERNLERDHAVTLTDYGVDRLDEGWNHFVTLHERRWEGAGGGALQHDRAARLQRCFATELARRGQLWLTTLDLDGEPAAAWYGFTWGDTVFFYQGGRDPHWERESVGLILMGAMIRRAIARGYRYFDFLRGDDPYKRQWTTTQRSTEEVMIFRRGWRGGWLRALDTAAELRARLRRGRRVAHG